jgi:hypothetical protein
LYNKVEGDIWLLDDDCRWFPADNGYHHPEGYPALNPSLGVDRSYSLCTAGCFAEAETVTEIESYPCPNPNYCDFTETYIQRNR